MFEHGNLCEIEYGLDLASLDLHHLIRSSVSHNGTDGMDEDGISLENRYSVHQFKGKEMLKATDQPARPARPTRQV